jgi:L-ascorbate metabolism protein UlaG (beta-lactamase superfamily)
MLIATLSLALATATATVTPQDQTQGSKPETQLVEVTYLANAGFLIRTGNNTVLIDALAPRPIAGLEGLTAPMRKAMLTRSPPFDRPSVHLVSHAHPDHFKAPFAQRVLAAHSKAILVSSKGVIEALSTGGDQWDNIALRSIAFARNLRNKPQPFVHANKQLAISFLDVPHAEGAKEKIENIAHLVSMENFKFIHLGDAAPNFEALRKHKLVERKIDVAFIPYWFYANPEGIKAIDEAIGAKHVVVYHIPTQEKDQFSAKLKAENPESIIFGAPMERKIFEVAKRERKTAPEPVKSSPGD